MVKTIVRYFFIFIESLLLPQALITLALKPWNLKLLNPKTLNPNILNPLKKLHNWVDCNGQWAHTKIRCNLKFWNHIHHQQRLLAKAGWLPWWETNERLCGTWIVSANKQTNLHNNNNKKSEAALKTCIKFIQFLASRDRARERERQNPPFKSSERTSIYNLKSYHCLCKTLKSYLT
jgi:hypothetical protein